MKRKFIMLIALSSALTMFTACSTNETGQLDIDPNMNVTAITSYVSIQTEAKQEIPVLKKINDESTANTYVETTEENIDLTMEYEDIEMPITIEN